MLQSVFLTSIIMISETWLIVIQNPQSSPTMYLFMQQLVPNE